MTWWWWSLFFLRSVTSSYADIRLFTYFSQLCRTDHTRDGLILQSSTLLNFRSVTVLVDGYMHFKMFDNLTVILRNWSVGELTMCIIPIHSAINTRIYKYCICDYFYLLLRQLRGDVSSRQYKIICERNNLRKNKVIEIQFMMYG